MYAIDLMRCAGRINWNGLRRFVISREFIWSVFDVRVFMFKGVNIVRGMVVAGVVFERF
jgi:hypothetical protein